jgi:HK97 family phage portal protein
MAGALAKFKTVLKSLWDGAGEGEFRPGPYRLPITGGWLPDGAPINWWQTGMIPFFPGTHNAMVEACVSAYSQTVAMCPGDHWRANDKGGRDRVKTSALARILRYPNDYQSISDFLLNTVRDLYLYGNAYAVALRNDRYEADELHLMNAAISYPRLSQDGEIFYFVGGNDILTKRMGEAFLVVPQRDVLHIRLHYKRRFPRPLVGETPLVAAYGEIGLSDQIIKQQNSFYMNEARPSAVLSTDLMMDKDEVQALRDRWNEQTKGKFMGGTPILTSGLKLQPWVVGGKDSAIAEMFKLSNEQVALAFRVPLQILGIGGAPFGSTELLMQSWIASGLGFCLNHIEEAIGNFFQLKGQPDEYCEFNTAALLRSEFKNRIDGLARGVLSGIFAPNEARNMEDLKDVPFGDEPRVQQQVVPLSAAGAIPAAPPAPPAAPAAPALPPPEPKVYPYADTEREIRNLVRLTESIGRQRKYAHGRMANDAGGDA